MKPSVRSRLRELGTELSPDFFAKTAGIFSTTVLRPDSGFCSVTRDIAYGADPRQRLDIFAPTGVNGSLPVVLFVHGGGFVRGDKGGPSDPFYNNIGSWAARAGFVGVTMTYRLAPDHRWPAGSDDVAAALTWLHSNVGSFKGDADRIVAIGHSAGAVHVAGFIARNAKDSSTALPAAAVMLSGLYDLTRLKHSVFEEAYFGTDRTMFSVQSTLQDLVATEIPCMFTVAEWDPPTFQQQAALLVEAYIAAHGHWPRLHYVSDNNHISEVYQIGSSYDNLGAEIANFVQVVERRN